MKKLDYNYSLEELKAYILLYCTNLNFMVEQEKMAFVKSKTNLVCFDRVLREFNKSNDYQRIQKILFAFEKNVCLKSKNVFFFNEIKEILMSNRKCNLLERYLFNGIIQLQKTTKCA